MNPIYIVFLIYLCIALLFTISREIEDDATMFNRNTTASEQTPKYKSNAMPLITK